MDLPGTVEGAVRGCPLRRCPTRGSNRGATSDATDGRPRPPTTAALYWVKDKAPGDTTGQDVNGVWYVLDAKGDPIE